MKKTVVLITSGQPSLNPRLIKEADALCRAGYSVTLIYQYWNDWGTRFDKEILPQKKWKAIRVGGGPDEKKVLYIFSKIFHKISKLLLIKMGNKYWLPEASISRTSLLLISAAKKIKADIYIGHNLGGLPATVCAAKYHQAKCGFDAEDFHRQEVNDDPKSYNYQLVKYLEDKYLGQLDYLTAASPLIADEYKKLYPYLNPTIINNVFSSKSIFKQSVSENLELKLFWFSQTIGKNRGLEDAITAIGLLENEMITLTLLGNVNPLEKKYLETFADQCGLSPNQLTFLDTMCPDAIFEIASKFDIGLALEPGFCLNNQIALSNKIFTYLTSGIAIIASETLGQKQFMEIYPGIGKSFPIGNVESFSKIIHYYYHNRDALFQAKTSALELAKTEMNWEKESEKFIEIIKSI